MKKTCLTVCGIVLLAFFAASIGGCKDKKKKNKSKKGKKRKKK